jgi:hypothetical protein
MEIYKNQEEETANNEVKVKICNELEIKDKPWYSIFKDFKFWVPVVISLIAIYISTIPYRQRPEIDGKIAGLVRSGHMTYPFTNKDGIPTSIEGIGYTINVIIAVLNKNINVKDFEVYIKYSGDQQKYKGEIIRATTAMLDVEGTKRKLSIPVEEELLYTNILEKEKVNSYFIRFMINDSIEKNKRMSDIEEIDILFLDYNAKSFPLPLKLGDTKRMLSFDEKYWEKID